MTSLFRHLSTVETGVDRVWENSRFTPSIHSHSVSLQYPRIFQDRIRIVDFSTHRNQTEQIFDVCLFFLEWAFSYSIQSGIMVSIFNILEVTLGNRMETVFLQWTVYTVESVFSIFKFHGKDSGYIRWNVVFSSDPEFCLKTFPNRVRVVKIFH